MFSSLKECSGAGDLEFDGLIDSKAGAHHIPYSCNYIHDHQKVGLIGSSDSDASGYALIEGNWFENAQNPVTSRDSSSIGDWQLRDNNVRSPADFGLLGLRVSIGGKRWNVRRPRP